MLAQATEHGYLVICNGEVTAFRYGGSVEETRMLRPRAVAEALRELSRTGWKLCGDGQHPSPGTGDYELRVERSTVRDEVKVPDIDPDNVPPGLGWIDW